MLSKKYQKQSDYPEISKLSLLKSELTTFINQPIEDKGAGVVTSPVNISDNTSTTPPDDLGTQVEQKSVAKFDYPNQLANFVEKLLNLYQKDIICYLHLQQYILHLPI